MERAETVRNPRSPESHLTEEDLRRKRNKERREAMGQLEWLLEGSLYKIGPDGPFDGRVYEGPIRWDVVVICPDSRDLHDPMYRAPYGHGALDAWIISGGELWQFVHGQPEEIFNTLP